jgi:hypothetical protein
MVEFETKVFVPVKNPGARMADIGGAIFFSSLVFLAAAKALKIPDAYRVCALCLWVLSIPTIFIGRRIAKGNLFEIGLSDTDLVLAEEGIRIGDEYYPHDQVTDLDFWIEGYDGMIGPQFKGYRSFRNQGRMSGADNKIHFRAGGKKHLFQFYLRDDVAMRRLGEVFRVYYMRGIPLRECNRGGPTFLFRQVRSKKELDSMKQEEGL